MSSFCLDTSAYSNFRRGNEEVAALLDRAELVGVPTVALGELRTGFLLGGRRQRNQTSWLPFSTAQWWRYCRSTPRPAATTRR